MGYRVVSRSGASLEVLEDVAVAEVAGAVGIEEGVEREARRCFRKAACWIPCEPDKAAVLSYLGGFWAEAVVAARDV